MNINLFSSFGFFLLAIRAKTHKLDDVFWGCILCGITSVLNHIHHSKDPFYRPIDMIVVNTTGLYFVNKSRAALVKQGYQKEHAKVITAAVVTLVLYYNLRNRDEFYFMVHLSAFIGIWFYLDANVAEACKPAGQTTTT